MCGLVSKRRVRGDARPGLHMPPARAAAVGASVEGCGGLRLWDGTEDAGKATMVDGGAGDTGGCGAPGCFLRAGRPRKRWEESGGGG